MWPSSQRPASYIFGYGIAVVLVAALIAKEAEARLPPKLLKVASGTRKALYARGYGYSVIPIPQKILLQANFARREVHGKRPPVRTKRPPRRNKKPPPEYASRYKDYRPGRKRRPLLYADPPEYHEEEQELDEEFDYEEHPNKDYEDFVSKHAELYANGYSTRKKPKRHRDEVAAYTENLESVYVRKPPPRWKTSTKLYSAAIGARPHIRQKEKFEYDYDESGNNYYHKQKDRRKNRYRERYRGERYREPEEDEEEEEGGNQHRYQVSKKNPVRNWDPDNVYHDRYYDLRQENIRRPVQPQRTNTNQYSPFRNGWIIESESEGDRPRWYSNMEENPNRNPSLDRNKWTFSSEQYPWSSDSGQDSRLFMQNHELQGNQRWKESGPINDGRWSSVKGDVEVKDTEIITSQNAAKWVSERSTESPKEVQDWVKEHSVGYGIELEGGQKKKRLDRDPDVVYGQAGNSKPRIPDIGYGKELEATGSNNWGQHYQS